MTVHMHKLYRDYKKYNHLIVDGRNLINAKTIKMFPNMKRVAITASRRRSFDLLSFLSRIETCKSDIKYAIYDGRQWMKNSVTTLVKKSFNEKGWNIVHKPNDDKRFDHWI